MSAADRVAASCSAADINTQIAAASNGDRVLVPAGSCTWNVGEGVGNDKGGGNYVAVQLLGCGAAGITYTGCTTTTLPPQGAPTSGQTTITVGTVTGSIFDLHPVVGGSFRLAGFKIAFNAGSGDPGAFGLVFLGAQTGEPILIDHNTFAYSGRTTGIAIYSAKNSGVVYRNVFTNDNFNANTDINLLKILLGTSTWSAASTMGTADTTGQNNFYFETNLIGNSTGGFNNITDANQASRLVVRYNTIENSSFGDHGYDSGGEGNRHWEFYNNTFVCSGAQPLTAWVSQRGGTGVYTANTFGSQSACIGGAGTAIRLSQFKLIQCLEITGWPGLYSTTYPVSHQTGWGWISGSNQTVGDSTTQSDPGGAGFQQALEPIYAWGNTNSTSTLLGVQTGYTGTCRAMATSVTGKAAGTTLALAAYVNVGQDVLVVFADLVGGTAPTISDGANTWTALQGGTNGSMRLSAWHSRIATGGRRTVTITFDSSAAARAGTLVAMRQIIASGLDANPAVVTDNTSPYTSPSTGVLAQADEIVLGYYALNGPTVYNTVDGTVTDTIAVTTPSTPAVSGPAGATFGIIGTTGGTDASNVTVAVTQRYVSATTAVSPAITNATANRDGLAGVVTFKNTGTTPDLQVTDFLQANREYYADGTVKPSYTAYQYPHPLATVTGASPYPFLLGGGVTVGGGVTIR